MSDARRIYDEYINTKEQLVKMIIDLKLPSSILFTLDKTNNQKLNYVKQHIDSFFFGRRMGKTRLQGFLKHLVCQIRIMNLAIDNPVSNEHNDDEPINMTGALQCNKNESLSHSRNLTASKSNRLKQPLNVS